MRWRGLEWGGGDEEVRCGGGGGRGSEVYFVSINDIDETRFGFLIRLLRLAWRFPLTK